MPQSNWNAILARLKAQMDTVANVGLVHEELQLATTDEQLAALGKVSIDSEDKIRMWWIHLDAMPSKWTEAGGSVDWNRQVVIEGFLQFEGTASAKTATSLTESIIRKLNADIRTTKLNGTILTGSPCSLMANEPRIFTFLLVHYVRIEIAVFTVESPAAPP